MIVMVPLRAAVGATALCVAFATSQVRAEDASPWQRDAHSALRLLAGSRSGSVLLGGIAIQLQPGWKTYWRTPGDSGVPPRFDFSKSDNVEAVTVLWPAPMKFDDGAGGTALGYKQQVVLPLRIVAKNADKPVTLRASINYAVCDKLCIPVEANVELGFPADSREYGIGSQMLVDLGVSTMRIMTNNPAKYGGLEGYGLEIVERVPLRVLPNDENIRYLRTKQDKLGHLLDIEDEGLGTS